MIVVTKNEEKNIENCLQSICSQTFKSIELIIVDNFSKDKTVELAKKYANKIFYKGTERSAQRNYGFKVASGKYLLYLDADMRLSPKVIEECVEKCESAKIDALYIPERIIGESFWAKVRDFERSFYTGTVVDAVRFARKDISLEVEGFDESLVGPEDWDFDKKVRKIGRTSITCSALYHNEGQFSMKRYFSKKSYYASGLKKYVKKWGFNDPEISKQLGLQYRLFGVFVEEGKWKRLVRHPILAVGMHVLRIIVAIEYFLS